MTGSPPFRGFAGTCPRRVSAEDKRHDHPDLDTRTVHEVWSPVMMSDMRFPVGLVAVAACAHHDPNTTVFDQIVVDPPQATLTVPLEGSAQQPYQVFGVQGGAQTDITADCQLSIDLAELRIRDGRGRHRRTPARRHKTSIVATCGTQAGMAEHIVMLTGSVVVGTNTPSNAPDLFNAATVGTNPSLTPTIQYPLDLAIAPVNIPPIEMQWAAATDDLFHVAITSSFAAVDVYTTDPQVTLSAADWQSGREHCGRREPRDHRRGSAAGGAGDEVRERGNDDHDVERHDRQDGALLLGFVAGQHDDADVRHDDAADDRAQRLHVVPLGVARGHPDRVQPVRRRRLRPALRRVHALRSDERHLARHRKCQHRERSTWLVHDAFAPVGNPFPDDSQAVALVSMVDGTLQLYDPDAGTPVASNIAVATDGPGMPRSALMADWSSDGTQVLFASTPHPGQWIDLSDSSIATMTYQYANGQHTFGEPQFLISSPITRPNGVYESFYFPSLSPDGQYIVFNAARSAWRDSSDASAPGQRLMLANASATTIMDLTALNGGDVDMDVTWPHWAPGQTTDYYWVVFSSERDYGHEVTAANTNAQCLLNGVAQCKQIWIAAISKSKLANGILDPSAPPMWLPGQDITADNISPYWTVPAAIQ